MTGMIAFTLGFTISTFALIVIGFSLVFSQLGRIEKDIAKISRMFQEREVEND
jgi:hypothetical protein